MCSGCEKRKEKLKEIAMKLDGLHVVSLLVGAALVFAYYKFYKGV